MIWLTHSHATARSFSEIAVPQAQAGFSWLQGFLIPVLFTFFGAALGFFASALHDDWNAERAKKSFVRAIAMELDALDKQLDDSLAEVKDSTERTSRGSSAAPQFAGALRTSVFTSQVEKLREVADPLLIEIIHFYSDLGTLERALEIFNGLAAEYNRAHVPSGAKEAIRPQVQSGLGVLQEQLSAARSRLIKLRAKLSPSGHPQ